MRNPTYIRLGQYTCKEQAMKDINENAKKEGTRNYLNYHADIVEYCKFNSIKIFSLCT